MQKDSELKALQGSVHLPGSVLGLLGCQGRPGLGFKSTSIDLWAGWRSVKPAVMLHEASL